jgi:VCBS repeat-containing protein
VITITGTNDVPVIDSATNPASIAEILGNSSHQDIPQQDGTISITDQDLGDTLTVTVTGNATASYKPFGGAFGALPVDGSVDVTALIDSGAISFDAANSNGEQRIIGWHYNPATANLDWLAQGDTLTITYLAQVNDGHGNIGNQQLVVTITGTNDVPTITGAVAEGTVTEDVTPTTANGTINFADVDLADAHTVSVTGNSTSGYVGTLSASVANDSTGDGIGQVTWSFNVDNADLQFLNGGQMLTQTYAVTVNDGHGGTASQNVTITLVGADDSDIFDFDNQATGSTVVTVGSVVHGTPGNDSIAGGGNAGNTIYGGAGNDSINGTGDEDTIFGGSGNDTIKGNGDGDTIFGGSGNDTIDGSNGNDIIIGNSGADQLTGGNGNDTFKFLDPINDSRPGIGQFDVIKDFTHNADHLDFQSIAGATVVQGSVGSAGTVDAHGISWFVDNANNQTIVYVNTTGIANHVDMEIHLTGSNINLSGSDILHHT